MKILKNTTNSAIDLKYIGINIPANTSRTVEMADYGILASSNSVAELTPHINSGAIVINDGTNDLSVSDALVFILFPESAAKILFSNSSNGFSSSTVQEAIEEARNFPVVKKIVTLQLTKAGSTSSGWLSLSDADIPTSSSPFRPLITYKVIDVMFTNENTADDPIRLKCYSQSKDDTGNISTSDTLEWEINSEEADTVKNASRRVWNYKANTTNHTLTNKQYGFLISLDNAGWLASMSNVHVTMVLQEV